MSLRQQREQWLPEQVATGPRWLWRIPWICHSVRIPGSSCKRLNCFSQMWIAFHFLSASAKWNEMGDFGNGLKYYCWHCYNLELVRLLHRRFGSVGTRSTCGPKPKSDWHSHFRFHCFTQGCLWPSSKRCLWETYYVHIWTESAQIC